MERGGVEENLRHLIKYFTEKDIKVSLISSNLNIGKLKIKKKNLNFIKNKSKFNYSLFPHRLITAIYSIRNLIRSFSKYKKENSVVFSMQSSMVSIIISRIYGMKVVARNSEDAIESTKYAKNYFLALIIFFLRFIIYNFAHGILTNSIGSKKSLELFVLNKKKITTIYNPYLLKIKKKNNTKKSNIILSIGRLNKQKDFGTLILGFSKFVKKSPNYKLLILGDGPEKNKLKDLIIKLNLEDKIYLKGWIKNTDKYFLSAKIFILTSLYEGLGNVIIDAVNNEVPCIYTNCKSGPNEILLGNKGGYQINLRDSDTLSLKIEECLENYSKSKKMILLAKSKINRFYYKDVCPKYLSYLDNICKS
tara:strand:- start:3083 stop:4171 length:1089 start_codon:yes stop_codon:yes gene_type:complete